MKIRSLLASYFIRETSETPFFIFLTLVLVGISAWTFFASETLRSPVRLIPFIILLAVHIALYWLTPIFMNSWRWSLGYLAAQGLLAFILIRLGGSLSLEFGLNMALIGVSIGMMRKLVWKVGVIAIFLGLSLVNYGLMAGWGSVYWWAIAMVPMTAFVIIYVTLYSRQSEARARAQALLSELEAANRQLADYAQRVEELTLANERQRMARELHDTLSQGLAGLILQLEAAQAHLANNRAERARAIVEQIMQQARSTLADARRAIDDLRHEQPTRLDLAEEVRREAARFSQATDIPCQVEIDLPAAIPETLCEPVRRAIAEGLTNVARHARASQVWLHLTCSDGWLAITLHDNGIGFDPQAVANQTGHYGLLGMRERARLAGGTLDILSRPGEGTTLNLRLKLGSDQAVEGARSDEAQDKSSPGAPVA